MRCALLTCDLLDEFVADDDLVIPPLNAAGVEVAALSWRDPKVHWRDWDLVIVRSTWDYTHHLDEFFECLELISNETILANPLPVLRWNSNKSYLRRLQEQGIPIVSTVWGSQLTGADLSQLAERFGEQRWIIKPTVSANADRTFAVTVDAARAVQNEILAAHRASDWMAQPFIEAVESEGEFSLFFFNGSLSHTILKTPTSGDFRVQEEHGGQLRRVAPEQPLVDAAMKLMQMLPPDLLYARLDFVRCEDEFQVMEVELIEPSLYLRMDEGAPQRWANAILQWFENRGHGLHSSFAKWSGSGIE